MEPLLDRNDGARHFIVEPAQKGLIDEPLGLRSGFWIPGVAGLHQVIDDYDIGADARDRSTDGGGEPIASLPGGEF